MRTAGRRGFTLAELICVVGVIGVLAAIALPYYVGFMVSARSVEADVLLAAVVHRVQVAREEGRPVQSCGPTPSEIPTTEPIPFVPDDCWRSLGFHPDFKLRYQLALSVQPDGRFTVTATGDLDDDGTAQVVTLGAGAPRPRRTTGVW